MAKIKAIIFDLDNTLYDEREYYKNAIKEFSRKFALDEDKLVNALYKVFSEGGDILRNILISSGYSPDLQEDFFKVYKTVKTLLRIDPEIEKLLLTLRKRFKLFVLTNGNVEAQRNKVKLLNIEGFFDDIVYAREFSNEKPSCESLNHVLSKWNLNPEEVLLIGDDEIIDGKLRKCGIWVAVIKEFYKTPEVIWKLIANMKGERNG